MLRALLSRALPILLLITSCAAQFPPTPEGVTVLQSKFGDGVTLSYKEVRLHQFSLRGELLIFNRTISAKRLPA